MSPWLIIACVFGVLLTLAAVVFGWLAWETRGGPVPYDPEDDEFPFEEIEADRLADTQEFDVVDAAFENYQQSIADILDANPVGRDELIRNLEAATVEWERRKFDVITDPLRRDLRFRLAIRRALRTKATT